MDGEPLKLDDVYPDPKIEGVSTLNPSKEINWNTVDPFSNGGVKEVASREYGTGWVICGRVRYPEPTD